MKTTRQPISSASFISSILRSLVINFKKQEAIKTGFFIFFVLLCAVTRYIVLPNNQSSIRKSKQASVELKPIQLPIWPKEMVLKSNTEKKLLKVQRLKLKQSKSTSDFATIN